MINQLLKKLADSIYGTRQARRKFEAENPGEIILASDASKGIETAANKEIERGMDWVTSQRAVVLLTDKRIVCGKWTIPLESIVSAQLFTINSLLGSGQVLKVQTEAGKNYQFGMQHNSEWTNQSRFPLTTEKGKLSYSPFSIVVRLLLLGYIIYFVYERFFAR